MKAFLTALALLSVALMSGRCLAADTVFLGAAGRDAKTGMVRIPVCLDTDKPLISFSVKLAAVGAKSELGSPRVILNDARLPWKDHAVDFAVDGSRVVFSVADLSGENVMVQPGKGWVFAIELAGVTKAPKLLIESVKAFDRSGNEVTLSIGTK